MSSLREKVENFLYKEARLMDENRYMEWFELLADPCLYWLPANEEDYDTNKHASLFYGDRNTVSNHVIRLTEGKAFAQEPRSRMRRVVSNIEIEDGGEEISVHANFIINEIRKHEQRYHTGRTHYKLAPADGSFKIKYKKSVLVSLDEMQENLTFLV
ncbi:MAG: aromatic-ring-hydroxylating dioxygenase subunit beta [Alphaproteobacteria bacterium]